MQGVVHISVVRERVYVDIDFYESYSGKIISKVSRIFFYILAWDILLLLKVFKNLPCLYIKLLQTYIWKKNYKNYYNMINLFMLWAQTHEPLKV